MTSAERNPKHTYAAAGTFTVRLTASNAFGSSQATKSVTVTGSTTKKSSQTLAVVAHSGGIGGSQWRSDLALANPSDQPLEIDLTYQATGSAGVSERTISLAPRESRLFGDLVATVLGAGDGRGGLWLATDTGEAPAVFSRTYAQTPEGNLGQGVPLLPMMPAGTYLLTGLYADARTAATLASPRGDGGRRDVRLYRGTGGAAGSAVTRTVEAGDQQQWALTDLFPGEARPGTPMSVQLQVNGEAVAYASLVDQASRDSLFLLGASADTSWIVPVIANAAGASGTFWRSDLHLYNPNAQSAMVQLEFLPEGQDNGQGGKQAAAITLPAGATRSIADVLSASFGIIGAKGALAVSSSRPVAVASRTYTNRPGGGTLGFGAPPIRPASLNAAARTLAGARASDGYRSSVRLVSGRAVRGDAALRDADGDARHRRGCVGGAALAHSGVAGRAFPGAPMPAEWARSRSSPTARRGLPLGRRRLDQDPVSSLHPDSGPVCHRESHRLRQGWPWRSRRTALAMVDLHRALTSICLRVGREGRTWFDILHHQVCRGGFVHAPTCRFAVARGDGRSWKSRH
jgi:PKD repeat protein